MSTLLEFIYESKEGCSPREIQIINVVSKHHCLYFASHTAENLLLDFSVVLAFIPSVRLQTYPCLTEVGLEVLDHW